MIVCYSLEGLMKMYVCGFVEVYMYESYMYITILVRYILVGING
jgi:hypothetical protein